MAAKVKEIEVGGQKYKIGRMTPKAKFHLVRRLAPLATDIAGVIVGMGSIDESKMDALLLPLTGALAKLPDGDANAIIDPCLAVCERLSGDGATAVWGPVLAQNGGMMYEDIDLPEMFQLVVAAIAENLGSFFPDGGAKPPQEAPPP